MNVYPFKLSEDFSNGPEPFARCLVCFASQAFQFPIPTSILPRASHVHRSCTRRILRYSQSLKIAYCGLADYSLSPRLLCSFAECERQMLLTHFTLSSKHATKYLRYLFPRQKDRSLCRSEERCIIPNVIVSRAVVLALSNHLYTYRCRLGTPLISDIVERNPWTVA